MTRAVDLLTALARTGATPFLDQDGQLVIEVDEGVDRALLQPLMPTIKLYRSAIAHADELRNQMREATKDREKPRLRVTKDYDLFEMHELNRDIRESPILLASMKAHGFMPSSAIQCVTNGRGKLKVLRGHTRLHYAKRLKLPVWYVVDDSNTDIYDLEADSGVRWTLRDFLVSRARAGDEACKAVLAFQAKHHLTQGVAVSLMGGEGASSNNKDRGVKNGTFKVAPDLSHAKVVVNVVDHFRESGVTFATQSAFVKAASMVLRVPECDAKILKHRLAQAPDLLQKRTNAEGYLDELEALYNYGAKGKRLALKFRAREIGRERQASFGKGNGKPRQ